MVSLSHLIKSLGDTVTVSKIGSAALESECGIELLDRQTALRTDTVYLGSGSKVCEFLNTQAPAEPGALLISTNTSSPLPGALVSEFGANLVETSLGFAETFNLISAYFRRVNRWRRDALAGGKELNSLQAISDYISGELNGTVIILDTNGFMLGFSNRMAGPVPLFRSFFASGRLSLKQYDEIKTQWEITGSCRVSSVGETGQTVYYSDIAEGPEVIGGILILLDAAQDVDLDMLLDYLRPLLFEQIRAIKGRDLTEEDIRFSNLWNAIMEQRLTGVSEIKAELSRFSIAPLLFPRVMVVIFSDTNMPTGGAIAQFRSIFPNTHIAALKGEAVILLYSDERVFSLDLEHNLPLKAYLEKFDAYLGYSNPCRDLSVLPNQYRIARQMIILGRHLSIDPNARIFTHEKYSVYYIIDLFTQQYRAVNGNNDIILLNNPAIIQITRYDREHNDNLRDVLYEYLLNDCSVVKTAARTYMHRNTILNKLNKISELVPINFDDNEVRQQLQFSCQLIRYYERVLGLRLNL